MVNTIARPLLASGDLVALVSPAGPLAADERLADAIAHAEGLGLRARPGAHVLGRNGFLAGTDEQRAADFNDALRDPEIRGVLAVRGGYGTTRILERIDYDALRRDPKVVLGYSDLTAPLNALYQRTGVVTYHGPVAALSSFSPNETAWLRRAIFDAPPLGILEAPNARALVAGTARGRLAGGNVSLISAMVGTPYAIDFDGAIVFIEEVDEPPYRVDRMLTQLLASGALRSCAGIVVGECRNCDSEFADGSKQTRLADVIAERLGDLGVPLLDGATFGHIDEQWTLPIGVTATLDVDARRLIVD